MAIKSLIPFGIFLFIQLFGFAQKNRLVINGKVSDRDQTPISNVTLFAKHNRVTVNTDAGGSFRIILNSFPDTLMISCVGFEPQEITLNESSPKTLVVVLSSNVKLMREVSITTDGYQNLPKERVTGSFETIDNKKLNLRAGSDILSRLEGVSTSILFDKRQMKGSQNSIDANNIIVRGLSTITESIKAPLIVLNNFPYEGNIENINPNDVENITILKDAAAASIWGARAANGVVVITTKKGSYNQPARLSLNTNMTMTEKPDLFYYPQMSSSNFIDVETFLFSKGFYNSDINDIYNHPSLTPVVEILLKQRNGNISDSQAKELIDQLRTKNVKNDFEKYIYRRSYLRQYFLNLSGGNGEIKYSISGGLDKSLSNLVGNSSQRVTVRSETSYKPLKNVEAQLSIIYTSSGETDNSLGETGSSSYNYRVKGTPKQLYPYAQLADQNGNPLAIPRDYRMDFVDTFLTGKLLDWKYRPLDELKLADNETKTGDILINASVNYKMLKALALQLSYQYQKESNVSTSIKDKSTYYTRDLINSFTQIDPLTKKPVYILPNGGIWDRFQGELRANSLRGQINISNFLSGPHELNGIAGTEVRDRTAQSNTSRTYGYNSQTLSYTPVDYINYYPLIDGFNYGQIPDNTNFEKTVDRFVSLYGNLAYSFKRKYSLSVSGRRDASNLFGVESNNKWKPFWSVGGAWTISDERFLKGLQNTFLRLRVTFGHQGNVNNSISPYTIITVLDAGASIISQPSAFLNAPANPDLTWENIGQLNVGLDVQAFKNRVSATLDFYRKNSKNLIFGAAVDPTTGLGSVNKNSASFQTKGAELSINSKNVAGQFNWNTTFQFSYSRSIVTDYLLKDGGRGTSGFVASSGLSIMALKGKDPYGIYSYRFAGLEPSTGDPLGYNGKAISKDYFAILNQSIDTASLIYNGSALPLIFGNINNTFSFKNISLTIGISYKLKYYFRKRSIRYYYLYNYGSMNADFSKRWRQPGDEKSTNIPSMTYPLSSSYRDDFFSGASVNVLKGDNVRVQFIKIGYDFPLKRLRIQNLQVYLNASNIGIIWKANREGIDPDYDLTANSYPPLKALAFGVKLDF